MRFICYVLFVFICGNHFAFSQQISVDNSVGLQQLIEDNLVQNSCVEISNITSSINGNSFGLPSYAYFDRASSNFPFQNGIMLSTGDASSGGNSVITPTLSEGSSIWGSDPDLDAALGNTNYVNATSIEFDIISISNQIQFNYLFASEDYDGINPCLVSDGFVFLIRETGSAAPYQNIAVVPGTGTEVNTNTIHPNLLPACAAQNEQYFDGYNIGDTNYEGRTVPLTASANITPYVQYHIKLIIADQIDGRFDSAVFIEGNSFQILNLGDDISTCAGSTLLNADIQNPFATYAWFLDNVLIPSATNSTHNAIQSGTYRVEVTVPLNNADCVEDDEIVVVLNDEEFITPISDYELCDDVSGDGIEIFDLSTKDAELFPNVPFSTFSHTYHLSDADARNNVNEITAPIPNTTSPQPIFIRIDDLNSNCFAYTSFNLIVNPVPNIVTPSVIEVCDGDDTPDGITVIDLTQKDDEITANQSNLLVSYHYNLPDANSGNNPIPTPYVNSNPTETVFVRVVNTQTGCVNTTTLDVDVTTSPIVNRDTQYIDACDTDQDGTANFDLTQVIADVLNGLSGVTPTFHETFQDAQDGINPIANESNYQNINPDEQTVYIKITDDVTGCFSIVPLEIHTNLLLTGTDLGDFALCDTNDDANDTLEFNLNTVEQFIANDLPINILVTFYETETDRDTDTNPIDKTGLYAATSPTTLYIRLLDTDSGCSEVWDITLLVNPILLFNPVAPIQYCDTDDDGTVSVDLASLDDTITGGNPNFTVSYFSTQSDADNNINQLPPFHPVTGLTPLVARIENIDSGCSTTNPFEIQINVAPAATTPNPIVICDDDQDGFSMIDFVSRGTISEIVSDPTGLTIDFFTTSPADKDTTTDIVPDITAFNASTQTIYIRVKNNDTQGCYNIVPLDIIVNTLPVFPTISNFQICQIGGNIADFLLVDKDAEILDGQLGKDVFYFENMADASNGIYANAIDKNNTYQNTSSPQTIHVRVENITDPSCFGISSFILQVSPDPIYNDPTPYLRCDDITNDEISNFDLNEKITEISQGSPDVLNISFHLTEAEAESNSSPLPLQYTNTQNPETIYIRIESDDSLCYVIEELNINIIEAPDITQAQPFEVCDVDYDGFVDFDLTLADFEILDRIQTNLITNYFANESDINENDGLDNSNDILNPSNYNSNTGTVYIKVANTLTGCYSVIPLDLTVNTPPPTNTIGTIEICDNETNTYDLSQIDNIIVDAPSIPIISYHNTDADAVANVNPIGNTFSYTSANHTIHVRVSDVNTGCYIIQPFILQINPNPVAITAPSLVDCDDDFDGNLIFDLSQQNNTILGGLNPSGYTVTYYSSLINSEEANSALGNLHSAFDGEIIYARLENNNTGCFSTTQFSIRINPLPVIPIDDIVTLCSNDLPLIIDAYTGNPNDTYLWSTGATTSQILLDEVSDIGNYWVIATTPNVVGNDCSYTHPFTVIESQQATNVISTTVNFSDPNSITVNVEGIGDYEYALDGGEPQKSNVFNNVTLGAHIVTIIDLNGCMPVDEPVFVIDIPKFVTPNNDGAFDTWHIVGANQLPGTVVYIYNRYGKLLKTLPHTVLGWDGTYNGENMPSDDYWFVAKIIQDGEAFDIKGHFALKR